jgi:polyferredoxin
VDVLHDRNPLYVQLSDGSLRNGFTIKLVNKLHETRNFRLGLQGLEHGELTIVGTHDKDAPIAVGPDNLRALKVFVTVPAKERDDLKGASTPFRFVITDQDGHPTYHATMFQGSAHD